MHVWDHLQPTKAHVAYACVGVFSAAFSLLSLFFKEKLYLGESTVAGIFGLIVGPHCLKWFDPFKWGNFEVTTLEITRVVLCIQLFAVGGDLPAKYMWKHGLSVTALLLPAMTIGWLILGLFIWLLIPGINFADALLISSATTPTDPILCQSVIAGKYAQKLPGHMRNLLAAESAVNDGMAFPFLYLALYLIIYPGNGRLIVKDWFSIIILYECVFGVFLGCVIGYIGRVTIKFAESRNMIDRESFLAFYIMLSFCCAGFSAILGVDDLLLSFAAGSAFAWDGWFVDKTKESRLLTIVDLLLNYSYFVFFGAIVPWEQFNNGAVGLNCWRLIILGIVMLALRRIPVVLAVKPIVPDIKSWREAIFLGHFGPIGVSAIFATFVAKMELEKFDASNPDVAARHARIVEVMWPVVCFFILTSIIVHGSSVSVMMLGKSLTRVTISKTYALEDSITSGSSGSSEPDRVKETFGSKEDSSIIISGAGAGAGAAGEIEGYISSSGIERNSSNATSTQKEVLDSEREFVGDNLNMLFPGADVESEALSIQDKQSPREYVREGSTASFEDVQVPPHAGPSKVLHRYGERETSSSLEVNTTATTGTAGPHGRTEHISFDIHRRGGRPGMRRTLTEYSGTDTKPEFGDTESFDPKAFEKNRRKNLKVFEKSGTVAYIEGDKVIVENRLGEVIDVAKFTMHPSDEETGIEGRSTGGGGGGGSTGKPGLLRSLTGSLNRIPTLGSASRVPTLASLSRVPTLASLSRIPTMLEDAVNEVVDTATGAAGGVPEGQRNYHAFRRGGYLMIENDEGDIIKVYKINEKARGEGQEERIKQSLLTRALNAMGLRNREEESDEIAMDTMEIDSRISSDSHSKA